MGNYMGILIIGGILLLVLLAGAIKNRAEWLINFVLRGISGMLLIYFFNQALANFLPGMKMGYNLITFLTSGFLGFPGVAVLYGINFYMSL